MSSRPTFVIYLLSLISWLILYYYLHYFRTGPRTPITSTLPLLPLFPPICHALRHRRLTALHAAFPPHTLMTLTAPSASAIQISIGQLEFPLIYEKALQFALFRTYGIPSISALLLHTTQLSARATAPKRYADTSALISEFVSQPWGGARWAAAVARMNCIHACYGAHEPGGNGSIQPEDMLYTLSLFAWEPVRWIERWEWRALAEVEVCAMGVYWKGLGDAMGISYACLPGGRVDAEEESRGWRTGLEWMAEVRGWAEKYEEEHMRPHEANRAVADETTAMLLMEVPGFAKGLGKQVVAVLMDQRLREAMLYPPPPRWLIALVRGILHARRFVLRYLMLPRPAFARSEVVSRQPSKDGRYFMLDYQAMPHYVEPTWWNRWGVKAWLRRGLGLPVPGDQGGAFCPMGYRAEEIGPGIGRKGFEGELRRVESVGRKCLGGFGGGLG
ncbi:hypothetical protein MMC13_004308 [Lambiella insularis]|nr:hypothetical protein [Lambiella insularis]